MDQKLTRRELEIIGIIRTKMYLECSVWEILDKAVSRDVIGKSDVAVLLRGLEKRGFLVSREEPPDEAGQRRLPRRYYKITPDGLTRLEELLGK